KKKNFPSDSETKSQITPIASKKKGKKTSKNPPSFSQSNLKPGSSQVIDLAQDSDKENAKVKHKFQQRDPELDYMKKIFSEPYRCKGYGYMPIHFWFVSLIISHQVPTSVCKKAVRVSGSNFDDVKNFYSEPYLCKEDVTTKYLQVFVVQERSPCIWKQSVKSSDSLRWLPSNWKSIRWLSTTSKSH
ncbi:hypothetical protein VP01_3178g4, partial [Puccinia sorghi]